MSACGSPAWQGARPSTIHAGVAEPKAGRLSFVEDDFAKAEAEARRTGRPIFVDAWAPWCHTCLSMRALTLQDPNLGNATLANGTRLSDAFVWLSIDTENPENAAFVERFPNRVWPTLYVLSSDARTVRLSWGGSATSEELVALLSDLEAGGARSTFAEACAHMASKRDAEARAAFEAIVADSKASPGTRARAAEALASLYEKEPVRVIELAKRVVPWMPASSSRAATLVAALAALDATKTTDELIVAEATKAAEASTLVPDDRSGVYEALVEHHEALGRATEKRSTASRWAAFLERTALASHTKEERFVYDAHRLLAAEALGDVPKIVPVLEASLRDFPNDGNAHARMAKALSLSGREPEALLEARRALALLEGPRSLRAGQLVADVLEKAGKRAEAAAALDVALTKTARLPLTANQKKLFETCEKRRTALRAP